MQREEQKTQPRKRGELGVVKRVNVSYGNVETLEGGKGLFHKERK